MREPVYPDKAAYSWIIFVSTVFLIVALTVLPGCTIQSAYVEADKLTYETVGLEWWRYVEEDPELTPEQVERRERKLQSWKARVDRGSE